MEEMDGGIQRNVETVGGPNRLGAIPAGPSRSKSCSSANATAASDRSAHTNRGESREEALTGANFCPSRGGGHRQVQEAGRSPGNGQTGQANPREGVRRRGPVLRKRERGGVAECQGPRRESL